MDIIQLIHNGYLILLAVRLLDLGVTGTVRSMRTGTASSENPSGLL